MHRAIIRRYFAWITPLSLALTLVLAAGCDQTAADGEPGADGGGDAAGHLDRSTEAGTDMSPPDSCVIQAPPDSSAGGPAVPVERWQASAGFSETQGEDGWSYLEWDGTSYTPLVWDGGQWRWSGSTAYLIVGNSWQHPDGNKAAVRRWTVPAGYPELTYTIRGQVKLPSNQSDGVVTTIYLNDTIIWGPQLIKDDPTNAYDDAGLPHHVRVTLQAGDQINFHVAQRQASFNDSTSWDPVIEVDRSSLPLSWSAADDYGGIQHDRQWSYWEHDDGVILPMNWDDVQRLWQGSEPSLTVGQGTLQPAGNKAAVLRWMAPPWLSDAPYNVNGKIVLPDSRSDGVVATIKRNGKKVWGPQVVEPTSPICHSLKLELSAGDLLDFEVEPGLAASSDQAQWSPLIYPDGSSGQNLVTYDAPQGTPPWALSTDYTVTVNGKAIAVYTAPTRYPDVPPAGKNKDLSFAYFDFSGAVEVEVTVHFATVERYELLPIAYGVTSAKTNDTTVRFQLHRPRKLTLVVNGDFETRPLHLFANAVEHDAPQPGDPNVTYLGPGYYAKEEMTLSSGDTLYVAGGAYVKGYIHAKGDGIRINGRGILSLLQDTTSGKAISPMVATGRDFVLSGIIVRNDPSNPAEPSDPVASTWSGMIFDSEGVIVNDYKVVTGEVWCTDSLDLINVRHVLYDDNFFRGGDDNISIKGHGHTPGYLGTCSPDRCVDPKDDDPDQGTPNEQILIQRSVFWSDHNNVFVLGEESLADYYKQITFRQNEILYQRVENPSLTIRSAMSIICLNGTDFLDITIEDVNVYRADRLFAWFFTDYLASIPGDQSWPGDIDGVTIKNITCYQHGSSISSRIHGLDNEHKIKNVTIDHLVIGGQPITNAAQGQIELNGYCENIVFK